MGLEERGTDDKTGRSAGMKPPVPAIDPSYGSRTNPLRWDEEKDSVRMAELDRLIASGVKKPSVSLKESKYARYHVANVARNLLNGVRA